MEVLAPLVETPVYTKKAPLSPLTKLTRNALIYIFVLFVVIQVTLAGFAPPLAGNALAALICAAIVSNGRRWSPIVGTIYSCAMLAILGNEIVFDLTHPAENKVLFSFSAIFTAGFIVALLAGISATVQNYRREPEDRREPRWVPHALTGLATICVGAILVTSILENEVDLTAGVSPETLAQLPSITTALTRFDKSEIRVKAGEMVAFRLDNRDVGVHSFDVDEFNVHAPMPVEQSGLAMFTPTKPGQYRFYCGIPGHETLMSGTLIVEP